MVKHCSSNSYQLDLNIFRSAIDTNFAVMAYRHPDKSTNYITDKQCHTYILHNLLIVFGIWIMFIWRIVLISL